jgi:hypothetical protein
MLGINRLTIGLVIIILIAFPVWYFFIDTLTVSQLVGNQSDPRVSLLVNFFDFDTGLTRYDIYHIHQKTPYWQERMRTIVQIQDPQQREIEHTKLMAEIMQDPSMKKITRKLFFLGKEAIGSALGIMRVF